VSFYTGTQCELLYAMPASAPAVTNTATTGILSANSTTILPYQLPAAYFTQQSGTGTGKSLLLKGGGFFTVGAAADTLTMAIYMDTTGGTQLTIMAQSGAITPVVSITNGCFEFEVLVTCSALGSGANSKLNAVGHIFWGPGNNAAAPTFASNGATSAAGVTMIGAPQTGVTITNTNAYYIDVYAWWSATTNSPSLTMSNFLIFGLN
jgi:hypothetical protein